MRQYFLISCIFISYLFSLSLSILEATGYSGNCFSLLSVVTLFNHSLLLGRGDRKSSLYIDHTHKKKFLSGFLMFIPATQSLPHAACYNLLVVFEATVGVWREIIKLVFHFFSLPSWRINGTLLHIHISPWEGCLLFPKIEEIPPPGSCRQTL